MVYQLQGYSLKPVRHLFVQLQSFMSFRTQKLQCFRQGKPIDVFNQSTSFENDLAKAAREGKINVRQADTKLVLKFQDDQHCRRVFTKMLLDAYQGERPLTSVACNNNKSSIVEEDGGDLHSVLIKVFQTDTTKYKEWKMLGKDIKLALSAYNDDKGGHTCVQNVKGAELQAALENIGARLSAKVYITEDDGKKLQGPGLRLRPVEL